MTLFIKKYHKGLKQNGYKVVQRKFPNKKKRTYYNCGNTEHFVAKCPYEKKENNYKRDNKESKHEHKKRNKQMRDAHIGHEWDSTKESSSIPRLFTNLSDDDDHHSPYICLMAKGEKIKPKAKPSPPPSDISSNELSESSSDDDLSDADEFVQVTKNLDPKTKIFITKLMEDLECPSRASN
jgi:hypothetical protein